MMTTMRERQLVRLMAQVLEQGWLNVDNPKFSAGEMSEAVASATGRKPDVLQVGALLSRMGVPATSRYRRSMPALLD